MADSKQPEQMMNVKDPDTLEIGSIPQSQLAQAQQQGYQPVADEEANEYIREQKYGSLPQQAAAFAEGLGRGALPFNVTGMAEKALGVPGEDVEERAKTTAGKVGELGGFLGSEFIPGVGEANLVNRVGEAAKGIAGINEAATLGKIGSAAVKLGAESAAMSVNEDVGKMLMSGDVDNFVQTAIPNMGVSALFGGATGAGIGSVSPLWKATVGPKVSQVLESIKAKTGGIEGATSDVMNDAIAKSGMTITPEIRAALSDDPHLQQAFSTLSQSDTTKSGRTLQEKFRDFKKGLSDSVVSTLGKTPEEVQALPDEFSKYESGKKIGNTLADEFHEKLAPGVEKFEKLKEKYKSVDLVPDSFIEKEVPNPDPHESLLKPIIKTQERVPGTISKIQDELAHLAENQGWSSSPSSDIMKEVNRAMKEVGGIKDLKGLGEYISRVGENTASPLPFGAQTPVSRAGSLIKNVLKDAESEVAIKALGDEAPQLVEEYKAARDAYRQNSLIKEQLNDRLRVGGSTSGFAKSLRNMAQTDGEAILNRLSGKNDANLLSFLSENFPKTAQLIKESHIDSALASAARAAKGEEALNVGKLIKNIQGMSPELRDFAVSPEQVQKLSAVSSILEHFNQMNHNTSNTARTLDKLMGNFPGSAAAVISGIATHNPLIAAAVLGLTKTLAKDVPDAVRLAMLKFMGSNGHIEAGAFKSMVDMIEHTIKGENLLSKAASSVFKSGEVYLPHSLAPKLADRERLSKKVDEYAQDPKKLMDIGGETAHYMPEHAPAIGNVAANIMNVVRQAKPDLTPKNPLDKKPEMSPMQKSAYDRVLDIVNQPLIVLQDIKKGTVTTADVLTLKQAYPALYSKMTQKLLTGLNEAMAKETPIPYKQRMGLSMFLGMPLDSTMTPQAIQAVQMSRQQQPAPQQGQPQGSKHSMNSLNKMAEPYQTPQQSRESYRASKG